MKPIEQLAKEVGANIFRRHGDIGLTYELLEPDLEALRTAIIKEFVSSLTPTVYAKKTNKIDRLWEFANEKTDKQLYDLSDWK